MQGTSPYPNLELRCCGELGCRYGNTAGQQQTERKDKDACDAPSATQTFEREGELT
jgi:hypothetical protein